MSTSSAGSVVGTNDVAPALGSERAVELTSRERHLARGLLVGVGAAFLVAQLALLTTHRHASWDESIYLSQVLPRTRALWFQPWRSRGITLLVAPAAQLWGSVGAVRLFLVVASSLALVGAFWVWVPLLGLRAALAAVFFAGGWQALSNASAIKPNEAAALLAVATAGLVVRALVEGGRWPVIGATVLVAFMALFRPSEAAALSGAVGVYVLAFRRSRWRIVIALVAGVLCGWLPWLVEMSIRFGGLLNALHLASSAAEVGRASVGQNVRTYLADTAGQTTGVPPAGIVWWSLIAATTIVAVIRSRTQEDRTAVGLCSLAAIAVAAEYTVLIGTQQGRYLLPAYGLIAIPSALGVATLLRGNVLAKVAAGLCVALVIPWAIWQGSVAHSVETRQLGWDALTAKVGRRIGELAGGRPCTVSSTNAAAVLAFTAGCTIPKVQEQVLVPAGGPSASQLKRLTVGGGLVYVVTNGPISSSSPLARLTPEATVTGIGFWRIYRFGR
jgi:hypothetical protein